MELDSTNFVLVTLTNQREGQSLCQPCLSCPWRSLKDQIFFRAQAFENLFDVFSGDETSIRKNVFNGISLCRRNDINRLINSFNRA